jgi:hypothetical protein
MRFAQLDFLLCQPKVKLNMTAKYFVVAAGLLAFGLTPPAYSQGGLPLWTNSYIGPGVPGNQDELPAGMAVDTSGNVFVTGKSPSPTGCDYATVAYSSAGVPMWTNRFGRAGNEINVARALAVDNEGNVFVTGNSFSSINSILSDYATIKYSGAGFALWTNYYDGPAKNYDSGMALALDSTGNAFVTGISFVTDNSSDYATVAYTAMGSLLWANRYHGPRNGRDQPQAIAVDDTGKVFVTGYSFATNGLQDYATVAYSTTGVPLWTNRYHGPGSSDAFVKAIAVGGGNVFVTGNSPGIGTGSDYATIAYSNAGIPLWTNRYNGLGNGADFANAVTIDSKGNVFVTGTSAGSGTSYDYATVAYSNEGLPLWTNRYGGVGSDAAYAVAVDTSGNVFVTGNSFLGGGIYGYATLAYSPTGLPLWTNLYIGTGGGENSGNFLAVDGSGNLFVNGFSTGSGTGYDSTTIKYSSIVPAVVVRLNFQAVNNELILSWTNADFNLQIAHVLSGMFTNIPSATSPYTNSMIDLQQYFRLAAP